METHDVIESYVRDVARFLPRDKRNDVAMEMRALPAGTCPGNGCASSPRLPLPRSPRVRPVPARVCP